jgi:phage-related protein
VTLMSYIVVIRDEEIGSLEDPYYVVERGLEFDALPDLKGQSFVITGRHGGVDVRKYLESRDLKINLVLGKDREVETDKDIEELKDEFLRLLNITGDAIPIKLPDFANKVFYVRVVSIDLTQWINDARLVVFFKLYDPYLYDVDTSLLSGNGSIDLNSEATYYLELDGPASDPVITIGSNTLEFEGGVDGGETLTITKDSVTKNNEDVLPHLIGDIPLLLPVGITNVSSTSGTLKTYYRRRYVF